MQELEYNPSKKDLTDAKIHHLLAEELCKPYRRHRRLSYSRHAVNDRDLSTQKLHKDGKQNHVSFPEFQQNGTAKQFTHDYINEVLHEDDTEPKSSKEEWDSPITFTAKSSRVDLMRVTTPTATESVLPWKRNDETEGSAPLQQSEFPAWASNKEYLAYNSPSATFLGGLDYPRSSVIGLFRRESTGSAQMSSAESSPHKERRGSAGMNAVLLIEEGTTDPLGVLQKPLNFTLIYETKLNSCNDCHKIKFAYTSHQQYLTILAVHVQCNLNKTFSGGLDYPRSSVIGLFRRESTGSAQMSSAESSPHKERRGSAGMNAVLLIEEGTTDPLGVLQKPGGAQSQPPTTTVAPPTPSQRRQARRGSMLELSGCVDDTSNTSTR
ncbi:hypothetical protein QE152_g3433 [Popillia japonica]|uniref:Uncharacterized protein n=1 Tax=Popillia japonica TaxID=7064 RepID=A0AAW1N0J8_POPJA